MADGMSIRFISVSRGTSRHQRPAAEAGGGFDRLITRLGLLGEQGIGVKGLHPHAERHFRVAHFTPPHQQRAGDGDDLVGVLVGRVEDRQFEGAVGLGIISGLADAQMHDAFPGQEIREHLPEQQQHDAKMNQQDADFPFAGLIITEMRDEQVDEQHGADEVTAGEDGNVKTRAIRGPINEKAAEEFVLGLVEAEMHLGDGAPEHNHAAEHEAGDRQLERRETIEQGFEHFMRND